MMSPRDLAFEYFLKRTDRKSLHAQIQALIKTAQDVAAKELYERRANLRKLLENEDRIYEEEFALKVKSRIDQDIKKRKNVLLKLKEAHDLQERLFLEKKMAQQRFESCFEIRDALRRRETMKVKETQLEQITEHERAFVRQKQLDDYWRRVRDTAANRFDQHHAEEKRVKCNLQHSMRCGLDEQVAMHKKELEEERDVKRKEAEHIAKVMEEVRLEKFDRVRLGNNEKKNNYRKELLDMIAENKTRRKADYCAEVEEHRALMRDIAKEERECSVAVAQRKRAVYNATMEYLDYVRRMRKLEKDQQKLLDARIDDLRHVDVCTKSNLQEELKRKAEIAALCYAELRRQICLEYERRLRDAQEQREQKIIENRFARPEKSRADIIAERRKLREGLDEQLIENARIRAEEEAKYNAELKLAVDDSEFCRQLAEKYEKGGVDYLPPHPNWYIYACPKKQHIPKQSVVDKEAGGDYQREGVETCQKPCGCDARTSLECPQHNNLTHRPGPNADKILFEREMCR
ncbi:cilia- and flagella-associated protein 53 [Eurosta solidaginis]|uniref:cilia- and flagella-associated protein 53 n=1 Tax=Eurosta solidaginis TaxID=178769 RepID=UPI003530F5EE